MALQPLTPERRRDQTRQHLLAAAAQVFAERGFHGASLDEVAAVAGFTKGAVYSNFRNKEDLFLALFKATYDRETEALRATLKGSEVPPEERLSDFVALLRNQTHLSGGNFALLYQEFWLYAARNSSARERLAQIDDEAVQSVAEIIEAERGRWGMEPLESTIQVARIIEVLFRGIGLLRVLQPDVADDEFVEAAISFVARGLGAAPAMDRTGLPTEPATPPTNP
jgi:AcrR family transcriptional regulator